MNIPNLWNNFAYFIMNFLNIFVTRIYETLLEWISTKNITITISFSVALLLTHTLIHEYGHYLKTKQIIKQLSLDKNKYKCQIIKNSPISMHTISDIFTLFEIEPTLYKKEIRKIARAGVLFSTIIYTTIEIITVPLTIFTNYNLYTILIPTIFIKIVEVVTYMIHNKEKIDETGEVISQPDRFLVKHPELFKNIHKL